MMEIIIENKILVSTDFSDTETAWMIEDAVFVLNYLKMKNEVILGGDILTKNLEHNYDSWHYNVNYGKGHRFNVDCSIKLAFEYISNYIKKNGSSFYVIFVTERDKGTVL